MFLHEILQFALFKVLLHVVLELEDDFGATGKGISVIRGDTESATGIGLPAVLSVVVVLGDDSDLLGDQIRGIEPILN